MGLQELESLGREMEQMDKKLRHEPVILYCLGCGKVISEKFTGGLWCYTHVCEEYKTDYSPRKICVVFGSKERGVMIPSSIVCGYKSYAKCKECKSEKEHIIKVLEGCFGKGFDKVKFKDKEVDKLRKIAILMVTAYSSKEYYKKVKEVMGDKIKKW